MCKNMCLSYVFTFLANSSAHFKSVEYLNANEDFGFKYTAWVPLDANTYIAILCIILSVGHMGVYFYFLLDKI